MPVLLYNFPAVTGVNLTPDAVGRLAAHPNIIGVKETGSDTAQVAAFVGSGAAGDFAVMAGSAPAFYPSLCVGATGGILAVSCVAAGARRAAARALAAPAAMPRRARLQRRLTPLAAR